MATSLYGTVKKIGSSQFTFDRIYNNRKEMEDAKNADGVYHGRYVFVSYGNEFGTNSENGATIVINNNNVQQEYSTSYNQEWVTNYNIDINAYNNVYDKTVWQKIFDGSNAKYIMVAQLNARAPGLTINEDYYSFNLTPDNNGDTYYIKNSDNTVTSAKYRAEYPLPKWHETYSNDLVYHLDMPMPLHVKLSKDPEYFAAGFDATQRSVYDSNKDADNYIRWEHILNAGSDNEVTEAEFSFNVPGIGQAVSDLYDAMYGAPTVEVTDEDTGETSLVPTTGTRPFIVAEGQDLINLKDVTSEALRQTDYKGILYILSKIGFRDSDDHYLLGSDWSAPATGFGHIDNKPDIITNITVADEDSEVPYLWTITAQAQ